MQALLILKTWNEDLLLSWESGVFLVERNLPIVSVVVPFFGFNQFSIKDPKRYPPKRNYNGDCR